jgi:CubicO group peptidase (beta-lactamase class C family)
MTATHNAPHQFDKARTLIATAIDRRSFPCAVIEVGNGSGVFWREAFGRLTHAADAAACGEDTIFDLASLTKVVATASLTMREIAGGRLALTDRIADRLPGWRGADRKAVTIRQLLDHSSGLPAHARFWETITARASIETAICELPLEYAPGSKSIYSDPGFMLLGFILERVAGARLDEQFAPIERRLGNVLRYRPSAALIDRVAPTEEDASRGRLLRGEVHDENAGALDGVAGHAGLFGTAAAVGAFARTILQTLSASSWLAPRELMLEFATRSNVAGSSRALAWDTMRPTSSCGSLMSPTSIGHTGFTGTSLWIDDWRNCYVVLLTNRVHPTRANEGLIALRPAVHDAIMGVEAMGQ